MGSQNNDEGAYAGTAAGVINTSTYPDQTRPHEDRADDGPLAIMWNHVQELRDAPSDMIAKNATIVKVVWKPGDIGCPAGFYECVIRIPQFELFDVIQAFPQGVKTKSNTVTNFSRTGRGYLDSLPSIGQECAVMAPATADPSIQCVLVKLGDTAGIPNAKSAELASSTTARAAVTNGGVATG
jgi:hypothetical protein